MIVELKPCPFCGGEAKLARYDNVGDMDSWFVFCPKCLVETVPRYGFKGEVIRIWNRRAHES